jgi:hypothetical protein
MQRNVVVVCGSNNRTQRRLPPLAKIMPHGEICGAFFTFGPQNGKFKLEVVGYALFLTEN